MTKFTKTWTLDSRAMAGVALLVVVVGVASAFAGGQYDSRTVTVASTTRDVITTVLSTTTHNYTQTSSTTIIVTTMSTVSITGPNRLVISGKASARGLVGVGVTATKIVFTSASVKGVNFTSAVGASGNYSVALNNFDFYNVQIFGTTIAGIGAGSCGAGAVAIDIEKPVSQLTGFDFSC